MTRSVTRNKRTRRRAVFYGIISANLALILLVGGVIMNVAGSSETTPKSSSTPAIIGGNTAVANPLDQVSSVDIALNVAKSINLTESVAVTNQADSAKITNAIASADTPVVTKPQVISTTLKTKDDIQTYITQPGDTVPSVAAKFNITSESIRWSNNLTGNVLRVGTELTIPPINGIVYTVGSGDTVETLAQRFNASKEQIIAFNDAEINGLVPGTKIVIPNGTVQLAVATASAARSFRAIYGYNTYDPGWCTYYAAARGGAPGGWGNANTWAKYARITPGWTVSSTPVPGAIAQTTRGSMGHVGIVEDVKVENGMTYIRYSDMNGIAGFNRVGYSGWVPAHDKFQNFIYR